MTDHLPENVLDQLVEGRASGAISAMEGHLRACPMCRARKERWERFHRFLYALPRENLPAGFGERMLQIVQAHRRREQSWRWAVIGSICCGLGGVGSLLWEGGGTTLQWLSTLTWPEVNRLIDGVARFFESPWMMTAESSVRIYDGLQDLVAQSTLGLAVGIILLAIAGLIGTARLVSGQSEPHVLTHGIRNR